MTTKVMKICKFIGVISIFLITTTACENDIENVGVSVVDNNNFTTNKYTSEVIAYNEDILRNKATALGQYLLGVHKDQDFGKIEGSIVSQLSLPGGSSISFGTNPSIDSVIIDIPYQATLNDENHGNGTLNYDLDSIIGDQDVAFKLEVFELGSYLYALNPNDPSQTQEYFTDDSYIEGINLYSGTFKPNALDTVTYVKRWDNRTFPATLFQTDTIKTSTVSPSIKIPLNETEIFSKFITNATESNLLNNQAFQEYFRGIYIKASTNNGNDYSSLLSLSVTASSNMKIYYTIETVVNEDSDQDLNGNGIFGEQAITIKSAQTHSFPFATIINNKIDRDYVGTNIEPFITNPDEVNGEQKLFIQGASGSDAVVELFKNDNLSQLRSNNWLINEANLYVYKDENSSNVNSPERLYLYNYDENSQITDVLSEGSTSIDGTIAVDDDQNQLDYYKFIITDFISEILETNNNEVVPKLGLKVYNPSDAPSSFTDSSIRDFSWTPKSVVLKGNLPITNDKRFKLEIFYSEVNN